MVWRKPVATVFNRPILLKKSLCDFCLQKSAADVEI